MGNTPNPIPNIVLTIAGFDPTGGAGIIADTKTIREFHAYPVGLVTSLTSQNSRGFYKAISTPTNLLKHQLKSIIQDFTINAIKIGMISEISTLNFIIDALSHELKGVPTVIDPIISPTKANKEMSMPMIDIYCQKLMPLATIITPNINEAQIFTGKTISSVKSLKEAASILLATGTKSVFITGGDHFLSLNNDTLTDIFLEKNNLKVYRHKTINTTNTHGTGCMLSSAIAANLAKNYDNETSVKLARDYILKQIKLSSRIQLTNNNGKPNEYGPLGLLTLNKSKS
jgi:hydroxymethylpyrimidine/phosphomethylpyrimidine kinase